MTPAVSPLDGTLFGPASGCFGCSPRNPSGFRLAFAPDGGDLVARTVPHEHHQGALGLMHGGLASTLADEAAAWAILAETGKFGFTTQFLARFTRGIRVGVEVEVRARLTHKTSRVVKALVEIRQEGELCFTGDFAFVLLDRGGVEKLLGQPLPEDWVRFCR